MLFRQLFDHESSTYTYLLADAGTCDALIIDPVREQFERDRTLIDELGCRLRYVIDTHVHADHVTGSGALRDHFQATSVMSERAGVVCADWQVKHGDQIRFGRHLLEVRETPGHTASCLSLVLADPRLVFTGDALLIRACGRTDFQQGDAATLYRSVHEQIFCLPDDTTVYPAHDYKGRTASSVGEERRLNPRLAQHKSVEEFVQIMSGLNLPYPKLIDAALPANTRCGIARADSDPPPRVARDWAQIELSSVGVPELSPRALCDALQHGARVVDVREQDEYRGELGHILGAELVPLATVQMAARGWDPEQPIALVCRSGGRSGKVALQLAEAGFQRVASLRGGMRAWNEQQLPTERGYIMSRQG